MTVTDRDRQGIAVQAVKESQLARGNTETEENLRQTAMEKRPVTAGTEQEESNG